MPKSLVTFEQLAGAFTTRLLSAEAFQTLSSLMSEHDKRRLSRLRPGGETSTNCNEPSVINGPVPSSSSDPPTTLKNS